MLSPLWARLGKYCFFLLLIYLLAAYVLLFTIIIRNELHILDANGVVSVFNPNGGPCLLEGKVRNVFGDPVPHAVIVIQDRLIQADNTGAFAVAGLQSGRFSLEIFAGNYAKYNREINLEPGANSPPMKYETGLWPQEFLVDFHIFHKNSGEILGITGFANGTDEAIYIQRTTLVGPRGEVIEDLLHDRDGFNYYAGLSSKLEITEEPQKALVWPGRMWQTAEFAPITGAFSPGLYSLEVHYAFQKGHELGQYRVSTITDHLDLDQDWKHPHLP